EELLFALALLGDDRAIGATYSGGRLVHQRPQIPNKNTRSVLPP
ncbi:MAG: Guanine deaminase, partial [Massilia sp.]|nr:Guanine deaminase [Massilia sp.]